MSVSEERGSPVVAVTGAALLGLAGLFAGLLVGILSISVIGEVIALPQGSPERTAVVMTAQGVGLVLVGLLYLVSRDLPASYVRVRWPSVRDAGWAIAATLGLFAALAVVLVVVQHLGLSATEHSIAEAAEDNPEMLLPLVPISVLVTGPAEELLFRGVIQTRLKEVFGTVAAVVVAALIFSLVHVPAYGAGAGFGPELVTTLGILFVLGVCLGAIFEYTGNLLVPAFAHGLYNAVVFGANYVEAIGLF